MLLKHIVVGLLLNTISVSQAADFKLDGLNHDQEEMETSKLYSDHY